MPCTVTSLTFTTPHKSTRALSSISFLPEQLGVIAEVAQKPTQLPHSPGRAVQAAGHETPGQMPGLEDSEADLVIRLLLVPAILRPIHPNQEKAIRNGVKGRQICRAERLEIAPHAAPSFLPR